MTLFCGFVLRPRSMIQTATGNLSSAVRLMVAARNTLQTSIRIALAGHLLIELLELFSAQAGQFPGKAWPFFLEQLNQNELERTHEAHAEWNGDACLGDETQIQIGELGLFGDDRRPLLEV